MLLPFNEPAHSLSIILSSLVGCMGQFWQRNEPEGMRQGRVNLQLCSHSAFLSQVAFKKQAFVAQWIHSGNLEEHRRVPG